MLSGEAFQKNDHPAALHLFCASIRHASSFLSAKLLGDSHSQWPIVCVPDGQIVWTWMAALILLSASARLLILQPLRKIV